MTDADTATPTFHAPSVDNTVDVTVELTVDDGHGHSDSDDAIITINPITGPADFELSQLLITPKSVDVGEPVTISVRIANVGGRTDNYTVTLTIDGEVENSRTVILAAGDSTTASFTVIENEAGIYSVAVDGLIGYFMVIAREEIENESPPATIDNIAAGENASVAVENTNVTEVTIMVKENVSNVQLIVQQLTETPTGIEIAAPGVSYKYLNFVVENIADEQIESVTIKFKVEKSWISQHGVSENEISLRRFDPVTEAWTPLPTEKIEEDDTYVYFSAVSPGLSLFAISGVAPDFSMSVSPISGSVTQGDNVTTTVSVSSIEGFSDTVSLSATGLPSGTTANFSPSSGTPSFDSTLTISTASTTPTGTYSITITGTDGGSAHGCTYTLTVTEAPSKPFPWALTIGIIVAVIIIIAAVIVIYRRRH